MDRLEFHLGNFLITQMRRQPVTTPQQLAQGIHEQRHHAANHAITRWADAVFVAPELVALP